jgi:ferric-dicitrate binding protein FerR (iron transport regulator)
LNGIPTELGTADLTPGWINKESTFESLPLYLVILELERQFNVSIESSGVDTEQKFTGSFSHMDLSLALKSVLTPFNISFQQTGNVIVLSSE